MFTRKAQAAAKKPEIQLKEESSCDVPSIMDNSKTKTPKKPGRKRNSNHKSVDNDSTTVSEKRKSWPSNQKKPSSSGREVLPDSFRVYRAQPNRDASDSDDSNMSFTGTSCSSCRFSDSRSGSDFGSSFENGINSDSELASSDQDVNSSTTTNTTNTTKTESDIKPILEPLQLVWAKCRGYPWYPALIIDPKIPKNFIYKGVPLPAPPSDVLALRKNYTDSVFLVLFFDAKRTWQWLPANKLELLGLDKLLDQSKLVESRKPTDKKAVKKAYYEALQYQNQVAHTDKPNK